MYNFKIKTFISEENLLQFISDYDVYKYYIGDFKIGQAFNSPFRKDNHASFNIGYNPVTNRLYYNDYILGGGRFIMFVMYRFNLTYREACNKIVIDLNLEDKFHLFSIDKILTKESKQFVKCNDGDIKKFKSETILTAKIREWQDYDFEFWNQYGISKVTLNKYNVQPVKYSMIGDKIFKLDRYAYVFIEHKDNEKTLTIYQPYSDKQKWTKNHNASVWYGWTQLPEKSDILIITKSRKDIMSITEQTGIPATGLQNEKIIPKENVLQELKNRFKTIYILYDNDFDKPVNWGRQFGQKFSEECDLRQIEIPDEYQSKDFSDLVENHGIEIARKVLFTLIDDSLPF
jgi:hypothetical protein